MLEVHGPFTQQMRSLLKAKVMGLGLVRLLQDAGRTEEARSTLYSLECGFQVIVGKSEKAKRKAGKGNRLKGFTRTAFCWSKSASTKIVAWPSAKEPYPASFPRQCVEHG